jgi:hypothetical protein
MPARRRVRGCVYQPVWRHESHRLVRLFTSGEISRHLQRARHFIDGMYAWINVVDGDDDN